jgi:hypothetical protein
MTPSRTSSSPIGQFTGQRLGPHPHSGPMRIQNVAWLLTSTSFVCTNSRVPSLPIRTTDRHAGTWCTFTPIFRPAGAVRSGPEASRYQRR